MKFLLTGIVAASLVINSSAFSSSEILKTTISTTSSALCAPLKCFYRYLLGPQYGADLYADQPLLTLGSSLTFKNAYLFPLQNRMSRWDLIRGGVIMTIPIVGYFWAVGYRSKMGHRAIHGKLPWVPWGEEGQITRNGFIVFSAIAFYAIVPTAFIGYFLNVWIGAAWFALAFHAMPSIGVGFCERFSVRDLYPRWSLLSKRAYWKAWAIVWPAFLLTWLTIPTVIGFFFATNWFYHVLTYSFGSVYLANRGNSLIKMSFDQMKEYFQEADTVSGFSVEIDPPQLHQWKDLVHYPKALFIFQKEKTGQWIAVNGSLETTNENLASVNSLIIYHPKQIDLKLSSQEAELISKYSFGVTVLGISGVLNILDMAITPWRAFRSPLAINSPPKRVPPDVSAAA